MADQVFKSKIDASLVFLIVVSMAFPLMILSLTAGGGRALGAGVWAFIAVFFVLTIGFIAWLFTATSYTISQNELIVRCGPITQRVQLRAITGIKPTRTILSAPALSLDRLAIAYGKGSFVIISPEDKTGFLNGLVQAGVPSAIALG